jgi:hypothetical protein
MSRWYSKNENAVRRAQLENELRLKMVGPNGLEPSTSSVSRKRSNQTELRAYNFPTAAASDVAGVGAGNVDDFIMRPRARKFANR